MTTEKMQEAAKAAFAIKALVDDGFFGWAPYTPTVQMRVEPFFDFFPEAEIVPRKGDFPWGASADFAGVNFITVLTQEKYDALGRDCPETLTDEDRRIMRELIEEERRDREARFWDHIDRHGWNEEVQNG